MKRIISHSFIIAVALTLGACATNNGPRIEERNVIASVIRVEVAPEMCRPKKSKNSAGKTLLGAGLGALLGNQFGSGDGRVAMTIFGTMAGAVLATDLSPQERKKMKCSSDGYVALVSYLHPIKKTMLTEWVALENKPRTGRINIPVYVEVMPVTTNAPE